VKVFWKVLRLYRLQLAVIGGLTLLTSLLEGLNVAAFYPVFESLTGDAGPAGGVFRWMNAMAACVPAANPMVAAVLLLLALSLLKVGLTLLQDWLLARVSATVHHDLKVRMMSAYAGSHYAFFLDQKQGELLYNITMASSRVGVLVSKVPRLVSEALVVAAIGTLLFFASPLITGLFLLLGAAYHLLTRLIASRVSYHTGKGRIEAGGDQTVMANELFSGIRQIITFGTQAFWLERFRRRSQEFRNLYTKDSFWLSVPKSLLEAVAIVVFAGLLLLRARQPSLSISQLPVLGVFALAFVKLLPSLTHLGQLRMEIAGLWPDLEVVHRVVNSKSDRPRSGAGVPGPIREGIELEGINFSYPSRAGVLHGVNLSLRRGTVTAVVGSSGSGKTTLAYLLLGLLEPSGGTIRVDGIPLMELQLDLWRKKIGVVSQDLFAFHASVSDNITFGRTHFTPEQIRQAAEIANADEFIRVLPDGYDTVVGERGMKLSGGQQQRLAIARAILDRPELLILDEATSFLDMESERSVQQAIENASKDRTVMLIAHRLSTVQRADTIIVLEQGRVVEQGSHGELLAGKGRYFQLVGQGR
jgi:ABC-type multidrug transport system fused ATPase/permease subunit